MTWWETLSIMYIGYHNLVWWTGWDGSPSPTLGTIIKNLIMVAVSFPPVPLQPPKGAKVYPASRRRSNKRVGLKGQLAPHCVPWFKNYIMSYKRLSTSLGSKLWTPPPCVWAACQDISHRRRYPQAWRTCICRESAVPMMAIHCD